MSFGGTSLLIVVGVAIDTMKQLESQMVMRNYQGFLK
jgi:preprotein translocase subunit SecY